MTTVLAAICGALIVAGAPAGTAHADPDSDDPGTTREVCGAFNLGVPQDQIA